MFFILMWKSIWIRKDQGIRVPSHNPLELNTITQLLTSLCWSSKLWELLKK